MRRRALLGAALGAGLCGRGLATPAPEAGLREMGPIPGLPRSALWSWRSPRQPEAHHRIQLAWPEGPPPSAGWPLVFLLDGPATFPLAVEALRQPAGGRPGPAVLAGLGYPEEPPRDPGGRNRDYTPPAADAPHGFGGAELFLDVLRHEIQPAIARRHPVDAGRLAMLGHSYGGLCVLYAFFSRPDWLWAGVAASPSIWWNQGTLLRTAEPFLAAPPPGTRHRRLFLCAGSEEEPPLDRPGLTPERRARLAQNRMVSRAQEMTGRLAALGEEAPDLAFRVFEGETHGSVVAPATREGMRFLLG